MLDFIENLQFLESNGVYLVQRVQARDVLPVTFDNIDDVVFRCIALQTNVCAIYPILL